MSDILETIAKSTRERVEKAKLLTPENAAEQQVPLGTFFVDPILSIRRKNILNIVAFDAGVKFDREVSDNFRTVTGTPAQIISAACSYCGVTSAVLPASLQDPSAASMSECSPGDGSRRRRSCGEGR